MNIAVLGGGFTGLTTSFFLAKKGQRVTLFEKEERLGGLASGFKRKNWQWHLEKTVHHLFANDHKILNFASEIGFRDIFFKEPVTASLYNFKNNYRIFPLDTPQDLLRFPLLSFPQKLRSGFILAFLKFSPFFSFYEKQTAAEFLKNSMGEEVWHILWRELFRKKFGKYAENILASFIWARIKKRTKKLGYIKGGFQAFIDYLEEKNKLLGVKIEKRAAVDKIKKVNNKFIILNKPFDALISTLPTPILVNLAEGILPTNYLNKLKKIRYLHALSLVLETKTPLLKDSYWLNIADKKIPIMGIFQQTNFIDKKYYGGNHICYLGWYVDEKDKLWQMDDNQLLDFIFPYLKKINYLFKKEDILNFYLFKAPFAQPIFDREFLKNKPNFKTPVKNFYIANLDMTYPYDRGSNYAVKLGKEAVERILTY